MGIQSELGQVAESSRTWLVTQGSCLCQDMVDEQSVQPHQQEALVAGLAQLYSMSTTAGSAPREAPRRYTR